MAWDTSLYGDLEDYGVDPSIEELAGFKVGDPVVVVAEFSRGVEASYPEDKGIVAGVTLPRAAGMFGPAQDAELLIQWDDMDPSSIPPSYLDHA